MTGMVTGIICIEMIGRYPCPCAGYVAGAQSTKCVECQHAGDRHPRQVSPEPIVPDSDSDEAIAADLGRESQPPLLAIKSNMHTACFTFEKLMGNSEEALNAVKETNRNRLKAFDKPLEAFKGPARRSSRIASNPLLGSSYGKTRVWYLNHAYSSLTDN